MPDPQGLPAPPPTTDPNAMPPIGKDTKERIGGAIGGALAAGAGLDFSQTGLGKNLQQHHDRRMAEAELHHKNAGTYAGILAAGIDPATGKPLTPEDRQKYKTWFDAEWQQYEKIAGVDKQSKGALGKAKAVIGHLVGQGAGGGAGLPPPPAAGGAGAAQPAAQGGTAAPSTTPPAGLPPPPQPTPYGPREAAQAPALGRMAGEQQEDARRLKMFEEQQRIQAEYRRPLLPKAYTAPDGTHFMGIPDENGQIISTDPSFQHGMPVAGALPRMASEDAPHAFNYVGEDGKPHRAEKRGGKFVDALTGEPLPKDATVFSAWTAPRTTETTTEVPVQQPDGSIKMETKHTETVRTPGMPGDKAAPSGAPARKPPAAKTGTTNGAPPGTGRTVGGKVPPGVAKAYEAFNGAQERYNVMLAALPDAQKGDQQAMLNLLANHIGMTMGLQKGSRITQAIYGEAEQSAPWLARIQARFDKDGYLTGVVLTPEQMQQMIQLAKVRLGEDEKAWRREVEAAKTGYGMSDTKPAASTPGLPKPPATSNDLGFIPLSKSP